MVFQLLGLLVLCLFNGVYIGKMLLQRRKGIRTDQIARGKKQGRLFRVELLMKLAAYLAAFMEAVSILLGWGLLPDWIRWAGLLLAFAGTGIFALSVHTMRDSWRAGIALEDRTEIVTSGIYGISRNPAFLGFDLTYAGLLLTFFHPVLLLCLCFAAVMLHLQILQEEAFLPTVFGDAYADYCKRVNRYLGRKRTPSPKPHHENL